MTFANRLKYLLDARGMRAVDLANLSGLSESIISRYLKGGYLPKQKNADLIAKALNVDARYLLVGEEEKPKPVAVKIPILGTIAAGIPIAAITDIEGYEEITEEMSRRGDFFALRIKGNSMMPWICPNDIVICRAQSDVDSGKVAVVLVNGDEATCKKVIKMKTGITLYGFNSEAYEPHFYTNREIRELPIAILGEVIEVRRTMNLWSAKG